MPRVRDVSFVRKLCTLDLPPQTLAQCLLPELRKLIPSHSGGIFWVDAKGEMTSLYAERLLPPDAMAHYYKKHYATKDEGFIEAFRRRAAADDPVSFYSFSEVEQSTAYFRDVMRPLDAYHILYGILKDGARAVAQISFYRGSGDDAFDNDSAATLRSLIRYVALGLRPRVAAHAGDGLAAIAEERIGVISLSGELLSASEDWRRLLRLAALTQVSPRDAVAERAAIDLFTHRICDRLLAARQAGSSHHDSVHDTAWGRFMIRAFLLKDCRGRRAEHVGLLIRREEPQSLSLVRGTGRADLSPQQREVALLIVGGKSNREIAEELGLSFNTASYHVKQIYARLQINARGDVAKKLLHLAQSAVGY